MNKNLRSQPFPDGILREMAVRFPTGETRAMDLRFVTFSETVKNR